MRCVRPGTSARRLTAAVAAAALLLVPGRAPRAQGALSAIQLGHAGRKVATKAPWDGFAPLSDEDAKSGEPPWRGIAGSGVGLYVAKKVVEVHRGTLTVKSKENEGSTFTVSLPLLEKS